MGNWRTAHIVGTCAAGEVRALRAALEPGRDYENFHPLVCGGLMGLPNWGAETIDAVGNLAERGYDAEDVAKTLEKLAVAAPSLTVKVHLGGDYESQECVNTITLAEGRAAVGPPEEKEVGEVSPEQVKANLIDQLLRRPTPY